MTTDRHELVRRSNVELVFREIGQRAPVSRADLVRLTGLSKPTVLSVVAALEDEDLIRTVAPDPSMRRAGRTPVVYEPNPSSAHVVGIDVGGTKVAAAMADLHGAVLAEIDEPTSRGGGAAVLTQLTTMVRTLASRSHVPLRRIHAVSVGTPGVENPDGTIRMADNVPGLEAVSLRIELGVALGCHVHVHNDVNLAAIGEMEAGMARDCRNFALLAIGTGIGLGLVIDGHLATGAHGAAGELAYLPVGADPATRRARRRGAFELAASGSGLTAIVADEVARANGASRPSVLRSRSSAQAIYDAAHGGDALAVRVVARHAELVARAVLAIGALLDPELVVLGGGIGSSPVLLEPVRAAVARITPWSMRIETSSLGSRAGVIGAVHHARRSVPAIESARVSARLQAGAGA